MHDEYVENLEERLCEEIKQLIFGEYESKTVYLSNILKRYDIKIDVRKKRDDDKSIDDLELSVRAYNYLKRAGINTLGELKQDLEDDTLIKVKCLDEVLELIQTDNGDGFETLSIIIDGQKTIYKYSTQDEEKETLFVRTLYFNTKFTSNEVLKHWMEFMMKSVYINAYDRQIVSYGKSNYDLIEYLNSNGTKQINEFFDKYNFEQNIEYVHASQGKLTSVKIDDDENQKYIFYKRKGINEPIPFVEEALGNQNLLRMLPAFLDIVRHDGILLIDEFSSGFHNDLERMLIKYFHIESQYAQMIFVSHSTNLLSNSLLRPDQEYAVEFANEEGSTLKRFSTEQPRSAQNVEKMYVSGIFGGLPHFHEV